MKQETKDKIKKYGKRAYYIVVALAWIMALIGAFAMSIYWCRQCAENREPQIIERSVAKRNLADDTSVQYYLYNNYTSGHFGNAKDYGEYLHQNYGEICSENPTIIYYNFPCLLENDNVQLSKLRLYFDYFLDYRVEEHIYDEYWRIVSCAIYDSDGNAYSWLYGFDDATGSYEYRSLMTFSSNVRPSFLESDNSNVTSDIALKFLFTEILNPIFESSNTTSYTLNFDNVYLSQLFSYSRVNGYDLIVDGSGFGVTYEIPLMFTYQDVLYEKILLKCPRIIYYLDNSNEPQRYDGITGSSTSYLTGVTQVYFLKYGGSYDSYNPWGNDNPSHYYDYLVGDVLQIAYREVINYQTYNNVLWPVYNLSNNHWNTYRNVEYVMNIFNDDLDNVPFPTFSSSDVTYPLSNLSISEILDYIGRYNVDGYNNSFTTDVGLGNVFGLLSNAFSGLTGLLSISIIPGITLGLLVFLPLVITIIIVILRLVKK